MDNDEGAVEERAKEKETKYHLARVVLRAGLRRARGLDWHTIHLSFIAGWKTSINKDEWATNLSALGISTTRHKTILQSAAKAALRAFWSMTAAQMGAGDCSIT
eukprot:460748-Rhodomonas_salina.1